MSLSLLNFIEDITNIFAQLEITGKELIKSYNLKKVLNHERKNK